MSKIMIDSHLDEHNRLWDWIAKHETTIYKLQYRIEQLENADKDIDYEKVGGTD